MSLHHALRARSGRPIRIGLIGLGAFGQMFAAQARRTPGMDLAAIADLDPTAARDRLAQAGWDAAAIGATRLTDDAGDLFADADVEVVIEATGDPVAGTRHALAAIDARKHLVMVNVEADALVGPLLARRAREAGCVYSLASGDQPALICELVDWARTSGLEVVAAGKGTQYLPEYEVSTPDTVWEHYGIDPERAAAAGFNPRLFNSFLDGTKSAIEMAAVANATGLAAPAAGLEFPPAGIAELAEIWADRDAGIVEVVSSLRRDGSEVADDLRWGVFVAFAAGDEYVAERFKDYGVPTDASGRIGVLHRPSHLIGLELGVSVASAALRGEPTGAPEAFRADVVAVAKRDLAPGEQLDGEGGHTVRGELRPAAAAVADGRLPIGLAAGVEVRRAVAAGDHLRWADVAIDEGAPVPALRRRLEAEWT